MNHCCIRCGSNPNNPVVILRIAILTSSSDSADRGRSIIRVSADPAVLKTGCQALVCQFLPNLYTNFTKLSNTPLIRQCALICTYS